MKAWLEWARAAGFVVLAALVQAGCGGGSGDPGVNPQPQPQPQPPVPATANPERRVLATALQVDASTRFATATITLGPATAPGATLEIGDLEISGVSSAGSDLLWADRGDRLELGLAAAAGNTIVVIRYRFQVHDNFDGAAAAGYTFTWPSYCGNLFPCQSLPAQGVDLSVNVANAPTGQRVIQPAGVLTAAPAYQLGWATGAYTDLDLGRTGAGTRLVASYLPGQRDTMAEGTRHLRDAFEWMEATLGPYRFGAEAGPVAVAWGAGAYGGMEHHPRWHIASPAVADAGLHVHEAAHGWFGNGVRLACWEDFVLSEGTASYLAARALEVVAPDVGAAVWDSHAAQLRTLRGTEPVWPQGCNQIDVVRSGLYSQAPYVRGAFFLRALGQRVGVTALDRALGTFHRRHAGQAARMQDLLDTVRQETGYDPAACAASWLRSSTIPTATSCS
ncbi:M1 family metallopeptidase [Caenimonas sedimenti]|uniref:M1 family metallopeptidase n=1 Tax=Caenimonas sedimenti TaxID=2596921 RepID=A0A562ZX74_9BURK|nr:M1 family aminopeptidase [Caenimonas sedimenti]TWO73209.1 M1 family metallopeptidase [Caenimonas sedimenti]